ncbi:galactokinase [Stomatobaculum longum]|jgi:galactokinase|uniref:galactokinase n=1 Tax=Stomatobaculum longum TaxID=796942 RepID=UPI0028E9BDC8|nr:galactokinase family protein [Stomatobaculum longum]
MNVTKPDIEALYGEESERARKRYAHLQEKFTEEFGEAELRYFSAPGRTEIIGNHTDHNGGQILAGSITLDTICAAAPTDDGIITIVSEGYRPVSVDTKALSETPKEDGSKSLVAGMAEAAENFGYKVGGFRAYVTSEVIASAGVSSSASFEMLVCTVLNAFYNEGKMSIADYARMGQYAENHWWNKSSGLMDQMACAAGGVIFLDFSEGVRYETIDFSFDDYDMDLFILNTGKGHADLTEEYSSIPHEMYAVAEKLGESRLADVSELVLLTTLGGMREKLGNDRALLRALHFFEENKRVNEAREAVAAGNSDKLLQLMGESGKSSYEWLQNAYCTEDTKEQSIPLALCLTELFLKRCARGTCRIHGGGFAGVIMAILPKEEREDYTAFMSQFFGKENIYRMGLRRYGAVEVSL